MSPRYGFELFGNFLEKFFLRENFLQIFLLRLPRSETRHDGLCLLQTSIFQNRNLISFPYIYSFTGRIPNLGVVISSFLTPGVNGQKFREMYSALLGIFTCLRSDAPRADRDEISDPNPSDPNSGQNFLSGHILHVPSILHRIRGK